MKKRESLTRMMRRGFGTTEREKHRNFHISIYRSVGWLATLVGTEGTALIDPGKKVRSHWPTRTPSSPARVRREFGMDPGATPRPEFRVSVAVSWWWWGLNREQAREKSGKA